MSARDLVITVGAAVVAAAAMVAADQLLNDGQLGLPMIVLIVVVVTVVVGLVRPRAGRSGTTTP